MRFDQQALNDKLSAIRAGQHDPAFRPARRTPKSELIKAQKKEERRLHINKLANERNQRKREEAGMAAQQREIKKKVRGIVEARKIKQAMETAPLKVNEGHIKLTRTTGEKQFKPRVGPPDLTGQIAVKVDAKTWIYVKPGRDIQEAIDKYKNRHDQQKDQQKAKIESKNQAMRDFD